MEVPKFDQNLVIFDIVEFEVSRGHQPHEELSPQDSRAAIQIAEQVRSKWLVVVLLWTHSMTNGNLIALHEWGAEHKLAFPLSASL